MITIIGAGKVGGDAALFSALRQLDDEILLLDICSSEIKVRIYINNQQKKQFSR